MKKNKLSINNKGNLKNNIINTIKKRWLISGTNTILLILILIAIVILFNMFIKSLDLTPIDCTSNKEYTLTEESKSRVLNIKDNVNIYFIGYEDDETTVNLAKQYKKVNNLINIETIDLNERTDLASKYNITNDSKLIIIENEDRTKTLYADDLNTYDAEYNPIDITEEKLTSSILSVTSEKIPNVYFLAGYSDYTLDYSGGMYYLSSYLDDEVMNYNTLDLLVKGSIPDDCDTLVITTPSKDFDELTTNQIITYINDGGNILWLNSCYGTNIELNNVNKILALYGINPFEVGYVYETDADRTALGYSSCIVEDLGNTDIDKKLSKAVLLNATKINFDTTSLENANTTETNIILSSTKACFRRDVSNTSMSTNGDEQGEFTLGGIFEKTLDNGNEENEANDDKDSLKSKLVMYADNNFVSDVQINNQTYPLIFLKDNKDVVLNSIAYLTNQDDDITIRKNHTNVSSFTATEAQKQLIMKIIFIVPIAIILFGMIVWQIRRRKK